MRIWILFLFQVMKNLRPVAWPYSPSTAPFWASTPPFWASTPLFWASTPPFWDFTPLFWASTPQLWASTPQFWAPTDLHGSILSLYSSWILAMMRIRIQLPKIIRIRIRLHKIMWKRTGIFLLFSMHRNQENCRWRGARVAPYLNVGCKNRVSVSFCPLPTKSQQQKLCSVAESNHRWCVKKDWLRWSLAC